MQLAVPEWRGVGARQTVAFPSFSTGMWNWKKSLLLKSSPKLKWPVLLSPNKLIGLSVNHFRGSVSFLFPPSPCWIRGLWMLLERVGAPQGRSALSSLGTIQNRWAFSPLYTGWGQVVHYEIHSQDDKCLFSWVVGRVWTSHDNLYQVWEQDLLVTYYN